MFLSKDDLKLGYGVDLQIGKFFVDRKIPEGNLYWRKRKLYMVQMPGYIFIPVYTDLEYRLGLRKEELLTDIHAGLIESVMDSAARLEIKELRKSDHINHCLGFIQPHVKNQYYLNQVLSYLKGEDFVSDFPFGYPFNSLTRADSYLLLLSLFEFDQETGVQLVNAWRSLMMYYLLLDDLEDLKEDYLNKEENSILEAGLSENGLTIVMDVFDQSYELMKQINPVMANRIDYKRSTINLKKITEPFLREFPQLSSN